MRRFVSRLTSTPVPACLDSSSSARDTGLRAGTRGIVFIAGLFLLSGAVTTAYARADIHQVGQTVPQSKASSNAIQGEQDGGTLEPGIVVERDLSGTQVHTYRLVLAAGPYVHVDVEQRGIDLVVSLHSVGGETLAEVNTVYGFEPWYGTEGPEHISAVAQSAGHYRLEVRAQQPSAATGRYLVRIEEQRTAMAHDHRRVAAESAFAQGTRLRVEATAESLRRAVKRYEEALALWRELGERGGEAHALRSIGGSIRRCGN